MLNREGWLDVSVNLVPLVIITLFVTTLLLYNPWGWTDVFIMVTTVGLHVVPILTLLPVSYLLVKVFMESEEDGTSETATRILGWFTLEGSESESLGDSPGDESETDVER